MIVGRRIRLPDKPLVLAPPYGSCIAYLGGEADVIERRPIALLAFAATLLACSTGMGQEWARKMFDSTEHNFGVVARGAKVEHRFRIKNLYEEDVHVSGVRSSCGCTSPSITVNSLKTYEKSELVAVFNTSHFQGSRSATLTVTIDKPFYAEVQVRISGTIRSDIVLEPGSIDLGSTPSGQAVEQAVAINYTGGRNDFQLSLQNDNAHLTPTLVETGRGLGRVSYRLSVRLNDDAPVGYIKEQLTLVTNDPSSTQIPVEVQGRVEAEISASPASLFMGVLKPGQTATKQLIVRGQQSFRIVSIECGNESFTFDVPEEAQARHLVPVTFVAGETTGKVSETVKIVTDLGEEVTAQMVVYAQIVAAP